MNILLDMALERSLQLMQDKSVFEKRQLMNELAKLRLNIPFLTLDLALAQLIDAGLVSRITASSVQITDKGTQLLDEKVSITQEYIKSLAQRKRKDSQPSTYTPKNSSPAKISSQEQRAGQTNNLPIRRTDLFEEILKSAGKPLHYSVVHEYAIQQLPSNQVFSANMTYAALYSDERFHLLGDGIFTLAKGKQVHALTDDRYIKLFIGILRDADHPLYYLDIHQKALESLSAEERFSDYFTYISLYSNSQFQLLANDTFALAEWNVKRSVETETTSYPVKISRVDLFIQILTDAGKPLHYRDIYKKALEILPVDEHFPDNLAYISLHRSPQFKLLGDGVFVLTRWKRKSSAKPKVSKPEVNSSNVKSPLHSSSPLPSKTVKLQPNNSNTNLSLAVLFAEILADAGKPLHYRWIHRKAIKQLPSRDHFSEDSVYNILDNDIVRFQLVEDGIFALTEWDDKKRVVKQDASYKKQSLSRTDLFLQILRDADTPLHYREIYRRAINLLPQNEIFSEDLVYPTLDYDSRFQLIGNGTFALTEWQTKPSSTKLSEKLSQSRAVLFAQILAESGKPLHYREIYEKALKVLPQEEHFSENLASILLHGNSRFRLLREGIFGLAEWRDKKSKVSAPGILPDKQPKPSRAALFAQILAEAGKPLHHREIYEKALQQLPKEAHFSENLGYISLHGSSRFRLLGEGIFGLAEWGDEKPKTSTPVVSSYQKQSKPSRAALFAKILADAGQPLHYREIYEKALEVLPQEEHFPEHLAYVSLHGSSRFRLLGEGIFGLAEWGDEKPKPSKLAIMSQRQSKPSRAALFAQILAEAGKPLHHKEIYEKALEVLPQEDHFPDHLAYISLHNSSRFHLLGEGLFALAEWNLSYHPYLEENGIKIFIKCPKPLLPENKSERSLFESVVTAIRIAQNYPSLTANQFIRHMAAWARKKSLEDDEIQAAFDTWYTVGLLSYSDYQYSELHTT